MRRRDPNQLTDREREVLELLRRDFTNEQIAQRLGISVDGAKYHVSQILSKLGVATREEAAALAIGERRRWWAGWPLAAKIAGAATVAAAVAGLAVLAWGVLRTGGPTDAQHAAAYDGASGSHPMGGNSRTRTWPNRSRSPACRRVAHDDLAMLVENPYIGGGPRTHPAGNRRPERGGCTVLCRARLFRLISVTAEGKPGMPAERTGGDIVYLEPDPRVPGNIATPRRASPSKPAARSASMPVICHRYGDGDKPRPRSGYGRAWIPVPAGGWGTPCPVTAQSYLAQLSAEECCSGSGSQTQTRIEAPARCTRQRERFGS